MDCLFCKIAAGEIKSRPVFENKDVFAFYDIDPKAPVHILIVPKRHFDSVMEADAKTIGQLFSAARQIVQEQGITQGFRIVINTGTHGGQSVGHLHLHLLGKRQMAWPPG
ncbi:MAG: histidine triad nucleotide-binding protein [Christensenellales bacterium]